MNKIIFPGSFDPITIGHIDLIKRAADIYDEVIVVVVTGMKKTMFSEEKRVEFIKMSLQDENITNAVVYTHRGLIIEFCEKTDVFLLLRGLRNVTDLAYEHNMIIHNKLLDNRIETICLLSKPENFHISSSSVRELIVFNHKVSHLVTKSVSEKISEGYNENI